MLAGALRHLLAQRIEDAVEQGGRTNRLDQHAIDMDAFRLLQQFVAAIGGDHDEGRRLRQFGVGADALDGFHPIHAGHHPIHQHEAVGFVFQLGLIQFADGLGPAADRNRLELERVENVAENFPSAGIVVHNQDPQPLDILGIDQQAPLLALDAEASGEVECAALSRFAVDGDGTIHHFHQLLADG